MNIKEIILILLITISCGNSFEYSKNTSNCQNSNYVIKIAEREWLKVYGKKIYKKKPFIAKQKNDSIWIIQGSLNSTLGGVPYAEINANTCEIIKITHGK